MVEQIDVLLYKFRFVFVGILLAGSLLILMALMGSTQTADACIAGHPGDPTTIAGGAGDSNPVAAGMLSAADSIGQTIDTLGNRVSCNAQSVARTFSGGTRAIGTAVTGSLHSVGSVAAHVGTALAHGSGDALRSTGIFIASIGTSSIELVAGGLGNAAGFVSHLAVLSVTSRSTTHEQIPVIDTAAPVNFYAATAIPSVKTASEPAPQPAADTSPQWPIHGAITTAFGVPEPPYEPIHTGLDISDGWRPGVTPVHPFKPGRVAQVIHGNSGLGNHIVIDHGGGLTSVYGHLYSTSVQVGQSVDKSTVLGMEGSTGVSTGTHLHFEIRVNGQPMDPHKFIPGQP